MLGSRILYLKGMRRMMFQLSGFYCTLTHQNLLFCRVPINPILGFTIRTYKKVGFSGSR